MRSLQVTHGGHATQQILAAVPTFEDMLICPNCGWKGYNTDLIVTGYDTDIVEQIVSGECALECPDCRMDAGHMLYGWEKDEDADYATVSLMVINMANKNLAQSLEDIYQVTCDPMKKPAVRNLHISPCRGIRISPKYPRKWYVVRSRSIAMSIGIEN